MDYIGSSSIHYIGDTNIRVTCSFTLPSCLRPEYWARHKLSDGDLLYIFNICDALLLWRLAIVLGGFVAFTAVQYNTSKKIDTFVSGRSMAVKQILSLVSRKGIQLADTSVLIADKMQRHIPLLPIYIVPTAQYGRLSSSVVDIWPGLPESKIEVDNALFLVGCFWIPTTHEPSGLCCTRIKLKNRAQDTKAVGFLSRTADVWVNGVLYDTRDERILVRCEKF